MQGMLSRLPPSDPLVQVQVVPTSGHGVRGGARTVPIVAHASMTASEGDRAAAAADSASIPQSTWGDSLSGLQWYEPPSLPLTNLRDLTSRFCRWPAEHACCADGTC